MSHVSQQGGFFKSTRANTAKRYEKRKATQLVTPYLKSLVEGGVKVNGYHQKLWNHVLKSTNNNLDEALNTLELAKENFQSTRGNSPEYLNMVSQTIKYVRKQLSLSQQRQEDMSNAKRQVELFRGSPVHLKPTVSSIRKHQGTPDRHSSEFSPTPLSPQGASIRDSITPVKPPRSSQELLRSKTPNSQERLQRFRAQESARKNMRHQLHHLLHNEPPGSLSRKTSDEVEGKETQVSEGGADSKPRRSTRNKGKISSYRSDAFDKEITEGIRALRVSSRTSNPIENKIKVFINQNSDKSSIKDRIMDCLTNGVQYYKDNKVAIDAGEMDFGEWQPLVELLESNGVQSSFIRESVLDGTSISETRKEDPYLKPSGKHEFIQRQHLTEAFLRSIGKVPGYKPDSNGVTWLDVYEALQVDTSSLLFYELDEMGNKQVVNVLYRDGEDPQIVPEGYEKVEGERVYQEVLITGGAHEGAAFERVDAESKAERAGRGRSNPEFRQSTGGSKPFHKALTVAFTNHDQGVPVLDESGNLKNDEPIKLAKELFRTYKGYCFDGSMVPFITDKR